MDAKTNNRISRGVFVVVCFAVLASAACGGLPYYTAEPFAAQVVDAETGKPIEGAVVVANWELVRGGLDGAHHVGNLEVKETVTDADGRFAFQGFTRWNPMLAELRNADPRVLVFKAGYEALVRYSEIRDKYSGSRRKAAVDGAVLTLAKLTAQKTGYQLDRLKFHGSLNTELSNIMEDCQWRQIRALLRALDVEKERLLSAYPTAVIDIGIDDLAQSASATCKPARRKPVEAPILQKNTAGPNQNSKGVSGEGR